MTCAWVAGYTKHSCWCLQTTWPHTSIQHVAWRWWETAEIPAEEQKTEVSSLSRLLSKNKLINMLNTDSKIHSLRLMFWVDLEGTICPQQSFVKGKIICERDGRSKKLKMYLYLFSKGRRYKMVMTAEKHIPIHTFKCLYHSSVKQVDKNSQRNCSSFLHWNADGNDPVWIHNKMNWNTIKWICYSYQIFFFHNHFLLWMA